LHLLRIHCATCKNKAILYGITRHVQENSFGISAKEKNRLTGIQASKHTKIIFAQNFLFKIGDISWILRVFSKILKYLEIGNNR
jgi:hypothetical protein